MEIVKQKTILKEKTDEKAVLKMDPANLQKLAIELHRIQVKQGRKQK
jgi:hypothetical protein